MVLVFLFLATTLVVGTTSDHYPSSGSFGEDPVVADMISNVSESEIYETTYCLQNFGTRSYGSAGNINAGTYLFNRFSNISGLTVEYQGGDFRNVIATLHGVDLTSDKLYVVGAHYDSRCYADQSNAPGATDNAGGCAIVLEFARIMSQYRFNHTIKFACWNAEEDGVLGSSDYAKYASENSLNIGLYVNFDSSCYDPHNEFVLDTLYDQNSRWVSDLMTQHNSIYCIGLTLTYNAQGCGSDHRSFWNYGYAAVMTREREYGPMHTEYDTVDKVSTMFAKKNGQLCMSVLATLAERTP